MRGYLAPWVDGTCAPRGRERIGDGVGREVLGAAIGSIGMVAGWTWPVERVFFLFYFFEGCWWARAEVKDHGKITLLL